MKTDPAATCRATKPSRAGSRDTDLELAYELAFEAARRFTRDGYPGVELRIDPDDYCGALEEATYEHAETVLQAAGFDCSDDLVAETLWDAIAHVKELASDAVPALMGEGDRAAWGAWDAMYSDKPEQTHGKQERRVLPGSFSMIRTHSRGRSRAARRGSQRRQGSRRGARSGSRGDPDGDTDPGDADGPGAWEIQTELATAFAGGSR